MKNFYNLQDEVIFEEWGKETTFNEYKRGNSYKLKIPAIEFLIIEQHI